jgi:hypothetical protein
MIMLLVMLILSAPRTAKDGGRLRQICRANRPDDSFLKIAAERRDATPKPSPPNVLIGGPVRIFAWISTEGRMRPKPSGGKSMRE